MTHNSSDDSYDLLTADTPVDQGYELEHFELLSSSEESAAVMSQQNMNAQRTGFSRNVVNSFRQHSQQKCASAFTSRARGNQDDQAARSPTATSWAVLRSMEPAEVVAMLIIEDTRRAL